MYCKKVKKKSNINMECTIVHTHKIHFSMQLYYLELV